MYTITINKLIYLCKKFFRIIKLLNIYINLKLSPYYISYYHTVINSKKDNKRALTLLKFYI